MVAPPLAAHGGTLCARFALVSVFLQWFLYTYRMIRIMLRERLSFFFFTPCVVPAPYEEKRAFFRAVALGIFPGRGHEWPWYVYTEYRYDATPRSELALSAEKAFERYTSRLLSRGDLDHSSKRKVLPYPGFPHITRAEARMYMYDSGRYPDSSGMVV